MELLKPYWNLLNEPVLWIFAQIGIIPSRILLTGGKVVLLVIALVLISTILSRLTRSKKPKSRVSARARSSGNSGGVSVRSLKRNHNYLGLGEYYARRGQTAAAIEYFNKAGAHEKEADQYVKLGEPEMAAELYAESGKLEKAAEVCQNSGIWAKAAQYHERAINLRAAAEAWLHDHDFSAAASCYVRLLKTGDGDERLQQTANGLLERLQGTEHDSARKTLALALIDSIDAKRSPLRAAELYRSAGELIKAGELFTKAGRLDAAKACFDEAGDESRATQVRAAQREGSGDYASAAAEYENAGQMAKAADCYLEAGSHSDAARCFEAADLAFKAAKEYASIGQWDHTNRVLQAISSEHPDFERSRSLLSSSFYELGNYQACVSSFKNELSNARVEPKNINDFYQMALALEELGELEEARDVLYKVNAVNTHFKDNEQRLSEISMRIQERQVSLNSGNMATQAMGGQQMHQGFVPDTLDAQTAAWKAATQMTQSGETMFRSRYRIDRELGRGGMGVVYKAHDIQLDRPVALKFLGSVTDDGRFEREARAAAKLIHSHVIAVFDFSAEEGESFIAMEYLEGQGLDAFIRSQGALDCESAIDIITKVCSALQAVHNLGIVHRDIKPANIVIGNAGEIKLLDFGLAKGSYDSKLTASGMVMGTPSYMPPEQVLGKEADVRTDLYSLGLVLFECLTGETTFRDENVLERQLTEMPPKFSEVGIDIPATLESVCFKAVAKEPNERYQSADEYSVALSEAMRSA
jgi:tetratricopeptide (TPR) repeat protein